MKSLLVIGGILFIGLAIFHMLFWKLFGWKKQLAKLHPVNKGAMQAMNASLILVFLFFAMLSINFQTELLTTPLGVIFLGFISFFAIARFFMQYMFFTVKGLFSYVFISICLVLFAIYGFITMHILNMV